MREKEREREREEERDRESVEKVEPDRSHKSTIVAENFTHRYN